MKQKLEPTLSELKDIHRVGRHMFIDKLRLGEDGLYYIYNHRNKLIGILGEKAIKDIREG